MGKGTKSEKEENDGLRKFRLLGDQVIERKKTKKLLINRWLYTHKIWGILGSPLYKKKPLFSSHTHTTQKNIDLIFTKTLSRQPQ